MKEVYIQTASFHMIIKEQFDLCLEKAAEIGYSGIEFYGGIYGGYTASELKSYLDKLGLKTIGGHVDLENTDEQLEFLPQLGSKYMICPGVHISSRDEALKYAEVFNKNGERAQKVGLKYGYHNHNSDFDIYDGERVIETLIKNTDPELVTFELDVGWVCRAGLNAAEFIEKFPGRFGLIHVKESARALGPEDSLRNQKVEFDEEGRPIFTPEMREKLREFMKINCKLGDGLINMPLVKKVADAQGTEAYVVEREYPYTGDVFTSVQEDFEYLKNL